VLGSFVYKNTNQCPLASYPLHALLVSAAKPSAQPQKLKPPPQDVEWASHRCDGRFQQDDLLEPVMEISPDGDQPAGDQPRWSSASRRSAQMEFGQLEMSAPATISLSVVFWIEVIRIIFFYS
jgi:hypothetical protein